METYELYNHYRDSIPYRIRLFYGPYLKTPLSLLTYCLIIQRQIKHFSTRFANTNPITRKLPSKYAPHCADHNGAFRLPVAAIFAHMIYSIICIYAPTPNRWLLQQPNHFRIHRICMFPWLSIMWSAQPLFCPLCYIAHSPFAQLCILMSSR